MIHCNLLLHMQQKVALRFRRFADRLPDMQPKTEEFLNLLLRSADMLARPTFHNLSGSYESWPIATAFCVNSPLWSANNWLNAPLTTACTG